MWHETMKSEEARIDGLSPRNRSLLETERSSGIADKILMPCSGCGGRGYAIDRAPGYLEHRVVCGRCEGTGKVLGDRGREILSLLAHLEQPVVIIAPAELDRHNEQSAAAWERKQEEDAEKARRLAALAKLREELKIGQRSIQGGPLPASGLFADAYAQAGDAPAMVLDPEPD